MTSPSAPRKSVGANPQRGPSSKKKERNVPLMVAYTDLRLKLCHTPVESMVMLRNGRVRKQDVLAIAKSGVGAISEET
jgi:hypothetical protein